MRRFGFFTRESGGIVVWECRWIGIFYATFLNAPSFAATRIGFCADFLNAPSFAGVATGICTDVDHTSCPTTLSTSVFVVWICQKIYGVPGLQCRSDLIYSVTAIAIGVFFQATCCARFVMDVVVSLVVMSVLYHISLIMQILDVYSVILILSSFSIHSRTCILSSIYEHHLLKIECQWGSDSHGLSYGKNSKKKIFSPFSYMNTKRR